MKFWSLIICLFSFLGTYASIQDSVGTELDTVTNVTYVKYFVEPGETIYKLSTSYGVSISKLMEINPELEEGLKVGQVLLIPYNKEFFERKRAKEKAEDNLVTHEVKPGETLYSISRKYNVGIGEILKWNGMELKAGQKIVVGSTPEVVKDADFSKEESEIEVKKDPKINTMSSVSSASLSKTDEEKKAEVKEVIIPKEKVSVYNFDPSLRQILVVPFDPHLYFSDADDAIAEVSNIPRVKVRDVFRRRLNALIDPPGYEVIHLLGGDFEDTLADLNKVYSSVNYNYMDIKEKEIVDTQSGNELNNVDDKEDDKSLKGWMNKQKSKLKGSNEGDTEEKSGIERGRFEGKFFGVNISDPSFFQYFDDKYSIDYYVFISQFEVVTDYSHCLDLSTQNYRRFFLAHYTIYDKEGTMIAGSKYKVNYDSNSNNIYTIVGDNMMKVADEVMRQLPQPGELNTKY